MQPDLSGSFGGGALGAEIKQMDSYIKEYEKMIQERKRMDAIAEAEAAVTRAKNDEKRAAAQAKLTALLEKYYIQDQEAYLKSLEAKNSELEKAHEAQIKFFEDVKTREQQIDLETCDARLKLIDEQYIAQVAMQDEVLAGFLQNNNTEIQAIIGKIALTDQAAADRLAAIQEEKEALSEAERAEQEARNRKAKELKEAELLYRIQAAETKAEIKKAEQAYSDFLAEEARKRAEAERKARREALDAEAKDVIERAKAENDALVAKAEGFGQSSEDALAAKAAALRNGGIDLEGEKKTQEEAVTQRGEYFKAVEENTEAHYAALAEGQRVQENKNRLALELAGKDVMAQMQGYVPGWYDLGQDYMENLIEGIKSKMGVLEAVLAALKAANSGGYGDDGDDGGEYGIMSFMSAGYLENTVDMGGDAFRLESDSGGQSVNVTQNVTFAAAVDSPAENARALKNVSKELAYGY